MVEYMPQAVRAAHKTAGNSGCWPANGSVRVRVERECAKRLIEDEDAYEPGQEWARIVTRRRRCR